jgi:hypothetical protein
LLAKGPYVGGIVGDQQHGNGQALQQFGQLAAQLLAQGRVQCRERFVQQQCTRLGHQCTGQCGALALAAGQGGR